MKKKERDFKLNIYLVVIFGIIFVMAGISMFFNSFLTVALKLKPDVSGFQESALQVHFVDTGEGDAILIKLPNNKNVLVDSGTANNRNKIISYIDNVFFDGKGGEFDYAILTHSDIDHSGNFKYILDNYSVHNVYRPKIYSKNYDTNYDENGLVINSDSYDEIVLKLNQLSAENKTKIMFSEAGAEAEDINSFLTFLTPTKENYKDENMYSPIVKVSYRNKSILLTGDANFDNEIEVINTVDNLDVDVLKLSHHGSETGTSLEFLNFCKPEYAIISCGENSYGHPSLNVLNNIKNYSNDLYNNIYTTQSSGNIIVAVDDVGLLTIDTIQNVDSYIYLDYYLIAIAVMGICLIVVFFPKYKKDN